MEKNPDSEAIKFDCILAKIATTSDGGYRLYIEVGENDIVPVMALFPGVGKMTFKVEMTPDAQEG